MLTVNTTASPAAGPRSLHAICELTRLAACSYCQAATLGQPCASSGTGPDGLHIARFAAAYRRGLITAADFTAVTQAAGTFGNATLVYDETLGGGR
jgi:hypothetical protein